MRSMAAIDRGVRANRGVRAAAGLDPDDARGRQRAGPGQDLCVLLRIDVVGDRGQLEARAHALAQGFEKCGFARADRPADADPQRSVA
jgi:hypothetical protein